MARCERVLELVTYFCKGREWVNNNNNNSIYCCYYYYCWSWKVLKICVHSGAFLAHTNDFLGSNNCIKDSTGDFFHLFIYFLKKVRLWLLWWNKPAHQQTQRQKVPNTNAWNRWCVALGTALFWKPSIYYIFQLAFKLNI